MYVATDTGTLWMGISSSSLIQIKDNINTNTTYNLTKSGSTITLRGSDGSTFNVTDSNTVYGNATTSAAGLMSAADKAKLDGVAAGSNYVTVDAELSTTSTNPVQNKVIKSALDGKSNTGHTHDDRYYTESEINTKLNAKANSSHTHTKSQITDFPTSMPASDVYSWAKQPSKPSYTASEVGAFPYQTISMPSTAEARYYLLATVTAQKWGNYRCSFSINSRHSGCGMVAVAFGNNTDSLVHNNMYAQIHYYGTTNQVDSQMFQVYGSADGKYYYLFAKSWDYNGYTIRAFASDFILSRGDALTSIPTNTYGTLLCNTTINPSNSVSWGNVSGKPSTFSPSSHTHDDRYYTESEVDSKLNGKADSSHSHSYLPLSGGTVSGDVHFASIGEKAKAAGINWYGSTDGASIYYETRGSDSGHLVLNMIDDSNVTVDIAASGAVKSYFGYDGTFHGNVSGNASSASSVAWNNVSGRPSSMPASDVYAWAKASSKPSYSWSEISNKPTIPSVGNGTVTITQNGTNKGSFTLNQSGNATIALTDNAVAWGNISGKPSTYAPSSHTHDDRYYTESEMNTKLNAKAASDIVTISSTKPTSDTCKIWIKI